MAYRVRRAKTSVGQRISNPADPHLFRHDAEFKNATVNVKDNPIVNKGGKEIVVRAEVGIPGQKPVNMDFTTYQSGGKYRTYNVAIEGASLVTVYRNQFGEIIKAKGIDGLIAELKAKNGGK
ncbi:Periplasmic transport protein [Neisseria gonorrhoeae]|nr:Periplasmic transport protein [Neisseria gonorrhoeae]